MLLLMSLACAGQAENGEIRNLFFEENEMWIMRKVTNGLLVIISCLVGAACALGENLVTHWGVPEEHTTLAINLVIWTGLLALGGLLLLSSRLFWAKLAAEPWDDDFYEQ
jgi:hypothetical protein